MEQYQSLAQSIEGLKRPIIIIAAVGVLAHLLILVTGTVMANQKDDRKYSTFEACHYGMKSLFENNPSEDLFQKKVIEDTKDHKFEIDGISLIKVIDNYTCDVVAKDANGFRSYRVGLEKNSRFIHFYRIHDVKGQKLVSTYQWRASL